MANELSVKSYLSLSKGFTSITRARNHSVTITGQAYSAGVITCTTNAQAIPIDLATCSYVWFCNRSTTETLDVHHSAATEDAYGFLDPLITLAPGQTAQFPPGDGTPNWYVVAQSAVNLPKLEYFAVGT